MSPSGIAPLQIDAQRRKQKPPNKNCRRVLKKYHRNCARTLGCSRVNDSPECPYESLSHVRPPRIAPAACEATDDAEAIPISAPRPHTAACTAGAEPESVVCAASSRNGGRSGTRAGAARAAAVAGVNSMHPHQSAAADGSLANASERTWHQNIHHPCACWPPTLE